MLAVVGSALFFALVTLGYGVSDIAHHITWTKMGMFSILTTIASVLACAAYGIVSALVRREVVVGTDGIAYRKTLRTEFIPYGTLASVAPDTRGVRLVSAREGEEAKRRVRIAVRASADEDLQGALEAAAEGEIDEAKLARAAARRA